LVVIDPRDARISELEAKVARLPELEAKAARVDQLEAMVLKLMARVEELEAKLRQNSSNSNQPPSSDTPAEREGRSRRDPSGRKRGGQPGHKGSRRTLFGPDQVTTSKDCFPERCRRCDHALPRRHSDDPNVHQVVDVPDIRPLVAQFNLHSADCERCGTRTTAPLPAGVPTGMCGPQLLALIAMLTGVYHLSRRQAENLLGDVLGIDISLGALSEAEERVSEAIAAPVQQAREFVAEQPVKHVDATGWKQGGKARTLWTLATAMVTVFAVTVDATKPGLRGLFAKIYGVLVTDRGKQFGFWAMADRQICWAHLIRKFADFAERSGKAGELGDSLLFWARFVMHHWHRVRDGTMSRREYRALIDRVAPFVEGFLAAGVRLGAKGVTGACKDVLAHREALWTFVDTPGVEPTNNHAERELRSFVTWRKACFGSQSDRGDRFAERIMTVAHTLRKQRRNILAYLAQACAARLRGQAAPSLLISAP
jgi:transposase